MFCLMKCIFVWVLLLPQPTDGGSVTWNEPTPAKTTSNSGKILPPGIIQANIGSSVTLNWGYNLTFGLCLGVLKFNDDGIVRIDSDGSAGPVTPKFQQRFKVSSTPGRVSLFIFPVTVADDKAKGSFICELIDSNTNTWKRVIQVQVIVPSNITEIRGNRSVKEGDNLSLICEAIGVPKPNITWTKEKPGNQRNTVVVQEGKVLNITNINSTNAGNYTCTAYNGFGKPVNPSVYVNVTYGPKSVTLETEVIVGVQQSVTLNCQAEGNPPPTYTWTPCDSEQVCDKNTLHISQVLNDTSYTCRVANVHGNDSKTAYVYIGGNVINITIVITSEKCLNGKYNQSFLLEKFKEMLEETFHNQTGYEGVQLMSVRCGRINVDLALKFNSTTKEQDVITALYDAVKYGKLGEFSVGAIKGIRPDLKTTSKGTPTPTVSPLVGIAWWIILTIVLAVVIVLALLVILVKNKCLCSFPVNNGKPPRVHSDEERGIATVADNQYAAAGPNVNYRASNPSSVPSVTNEVANRSSEGRRGNIAGVQSWSKTVSVFFTKQASHSEKKPRNVTNIRVPHIYFI